MLKKSNMKYLPISEGKLLSANIVGTTPRNVKAKNDEVASGQALVKKETTDLSFFPILKK